MKVQITIPADLESARIRLASGLDGISYAYLPGAMGRAKAAADKASKEVTGPATHEVEIGIRAKQSNTPEFAEPISQECLDHSLAAAALYELGFRKGVALKRALDCTAIETSTAA